MEKIRAVIFDCDGVVIDSGADMADAMNATLGHFGMKQLSEKEIVSFVGNGARMLVMRAVKSSIGFAGMNASDIPPERMKQILDWYTEYYYAHAVERTVLYPGYAELLEKMMFHGYHMAVVSNKPGEITRKILRYFDIEDYYDAVIGPEQLAHIKPDPEGLALAVSIMNQNLRYAAGGRPFVSITPSETLMVGDSYVDIQAGHNFKSHTCAVLGGLGDKEKLAAEHADITVQYAGELRAKLAL